MHIRLFSVLLLLLLATDIHAQTAEGRWGRKAPLLEANSEFAAVELDGNEIADLAPLKDLKNIQLLSLKNNKIKDLSPLAGVASLRRLDIRGAPATDVSMLPPGCEIVSAETYRRARRGR